MRETKAAVILSLNEPKVRLVKFQPIISLETKLANRSFVIAIVFTSTDGRLAEVISKELELNEIDKNFLAVCLTLQ